MSKCQAERKKTKRLLDDYEVPVLFRDDLFRYAQERRRPPYRWLVIGPARSGTGIHVDPLGTSAWNALIHGHKRWCLFRPNVPKYVLKPTAAESGKHPEEAITWFFTVYERVRSAEWPAEFQPIEAVQQPGEIMFVPSGWWHVVVNLDETVAVTQNFCSPTILPVVWNKTVRGRPKFSKHWFRVLRKCRPELLPVIKGAADVDDAIESSSSDSSSSSSSSSDHSSDNDEDHRAIFGNGNHSLVKFHSDSPPRRSKRRLEGMEQDAQHNVQECANKIRRSPV